MDADEISILKQVLFIGVPGVLVLAFYVMAMETRDSNWLLSGLGAICIGLALFGATWTPTS